MIDNQKVGQRIATLRRAKGITQERLAEMLDVTGQAVSKWENGYALPDIGLLPALGRILGTSLDLLLNPYDLFALEARYGANGIFADVAVIVNARMDENGLCLRVGNDTLGADPLPGVCKYLTVRCLGPEGVFYAFAAQGDALRLTPTMKGLPPVSGGLEVLAARYGRDLLTSDVTSRLRECLGARQMEAIPVDHEWFASPPAVDEPEYLSVLYRNRDGFFVLAVPEGGALGVSADGRSLYEVRSGQAARRCRKLPGVGKLAWGQGQECTYAGALTAALRAMGEDVSYEAVMGVSGACWRLAFCLSWDYSSVDGLVVYDHAAPAWKALGYEFKGYDRVEKRDRERTRAEIVESIDRGAPVLAIDLRVAPEWGVVTGYADGGKTLWCRTYFDGDAPDYVRAERWPFIILFFGKKGAPLPARASLLRSLAIFSEEMNIPQERGYAVGYHAYEAWSGDLDDDARFDGLDEAAFRRMMSVNHFCYLALVDARRAGSAYLASCRGLLEGGAATHLETAAGLVAQVAQKLADGWPWVPSEEQCQGDPRQWWSSAMRHSQAALLREVAALEKQVEEAFRATLAAAG